MKLNLPLLPAIGRSVEGKSVFNLHFKQPMKKQVVEEMRVSVTLLSLLLLPASLLPLSSAFDPEAGAALLLFARSANSIIIPIMRWTTPDPCGNPTDGWLGVGCTFEGKVYAVNVTGILLAGTIAANTLGNVTTLTNLTLQGTGLTGKLPTDLIHHPGLRSVRLNGNSFSGAIPVFGNSKSLDVLNLADNSFTSAVPPGLNGNSQLRVLRLENNLLSGDLPNLNLPLLQDFSVASNQNLTGAIPEGLIRFGESAFSGDNGLCGPPLNTSCSPAPGAPGSAPAPTKNFKKKKLTTGEIAAIILADMVLLLFITACFYIHYSKKYTKAANSEEKLKPGKKEGAKSTTTTTTTTTTTVDKSEYTPSAASQSFLDSAAAVRPVEDIAAKSRLVFFPGHPHTFDLEDLLRASAEMLGKGSFGTAYKALLEGGAEVAVKRLRDLRDSGRKEFEQQMELVGKLRHPNLIPLKAYYYAREEKLLVYDYQPNGSLYSLLHGNRQSPDRVPFDWASRLRTALGVARGLEYLHRECESQKMPHGNIKSSNILLDKDMEPCITDFGLAPLMTASMAASRLVGYRAPEYSQSKRITQKADVYSFGVLLLELLTGRIPSQSGSNGGGDGGIDLPRWVHSVVREEWTAEVFDLELMMYSDIEEEMVGLLQVAMKCVANSADARPKMSDVVKLIEDIRGPDPYGDDTTDFSSEMSESGLTPVAESPLPRT